MSRGEYVYSVRHGFNVGMKPVHAALDAIYEFEQVVVFIPQYLLPDFLDRYLPRFAQDVLIKGVSKSVFAM